MNHGHDQVEAVPAARRTKEVGADWRGVEGIFGGKVIALLADAVMAAPGTGRHELASMWVEFSGSVVPGELHDEVEVAHLGRSTASVRASLSQQGRQKASAVAKLVAPDGGQPTLPTARRLPVAPSPDELDDLVPPWGELSYDPKVQVRVIEHLVLDGVLTTRAWVRVRPGHGADLGVGGVEAVLLDVLPPGLFMTGTPPSFVPTVDFALHLSPGARAVAGDWFWGEMRTEWVEGGFCAETGEIRRADGTFVARGTQTRRVVR